MDPQTQVAIDAFRVLEIAILRAEAAEYYLEKILSKSDVDIHEYYQNTEQIRAEFERKRDVMARQGRLPERTRRV